MVFGPAAELLLGHSLYTHDIMSSILCLYFSYAITPWTCYLNKCYIQLKKGKMYENVY